MSSTIGSGTPAAAPAGGPARERETPRSAAPWSLIKRFLIAREGSIIVVTVLLTVYFALTLPAFVSTGNRCV